MSKVPSIDEAREILSKYNKEEFHMRHGEIVSGVMRYFAREYDPEREEFWGVVGMLHDLDFEMYPEEHCTKGQELLREHGVSEDVIYSAMSHGYGIMPVEFEPREFMEKVLFAVDELTGLIGAVTLMRPSKSVDDLELKSVKKKFKDKSFAAGCSRDTIRQGAEMLGWELDDLIEKTIMAMRSLNPEMGV